MAQTAPTTLPDPLPLIHELAALERPTWDRRAAAIPAFHPRNEGEPTGGAAAAAAGSSGTGEGAPTGDAPAGGTGDGDGPGKGDDEPKMFDEAYVKKLREENARYRQRAKRADELEAEQQEREDAERTELERERSARETAEKRAAELEHEKLRRKVADAHGLDAELADLLVGDDEESLTTKAKLLADRLKDGKKPAPKVPGGPQGTADQMSADEARRLAKDNPAEFNRKFDAGEIPAAALGKQ